jgi:hypothetical protein
LIVPEKLEPAPAEGLSDFVVFPAPPSAVTLQIIWRGTLRGIWRAEAVGWYGGAAVALSSTLCDNAGVVTGQRLPLRGKPLMLLPRRDWRYSGVSPALSKNDTRRRNSPLCSFRNGGLVGLGYAR